MKENFPLKEPLGDVTASNKLRAGFYVDGFNLYHAIHALRSEDNVRLNHLKWLDLKKLCSLFLDKKMENIARILWCSAYPTRVRNQDESAKRNRHKIYADALTATGVEISMGHFTYPEIECKLCNGMYEQPSEKCSDINVSLHAAEDVLLGRIDVVYIISADSDQAATAKFIRERRPEIKMIAIAPPGRDHSVEVIKYVTSTSNITLENLEGSLFPKMVLNPSGKAAVQRPPKYEARLQAIRKPKVHIPAKHR